MIRKIAVGHKKGPGEETKLAIHLATKKKLRQKQEVYRRIATKTLKSSTLRNKINLSFLCVRRETWIRFRLQYDWLKFTWNIGSCQLTTSYFLYCFCTIHRRGDVLFGTDRFTDTYDAFSFALNFSLTYDIIFFSRVILIV